jgi:hypothetical protein
MIPLLDVISARYNSGMNTTQTLDRLFDPVGKTFGVKTAKAIANLRADPDFQAKMEDLAHRCTEGELTPDEKAEYDALVSANNVIAILQAKARAVLARRRKKK